MTSYELKGFAQRRVDGIYFARIGKKGGQVKHVQLTADASPEPFQLNNYKQPTTHLTQDGFDVFIMAGPFRKPPFSRQVTQWEFDRWCKNNPDERVLFDWNAFIWDQVQAENFTEP